MCFFTASRMMTLLAALFLSTYGAGATEAVHGKEPHWIDGLRNGENSSCCGDDDCRAVSSIYVLVMDGDTMNVVINGNIIARIPATSRVPIDYRRGPHVCLQRSIIHEGKEMPCAWENQDGSLGILPVPDCFRCILMPYCPS